MFKVAVTVTDSPAVAVVGEMPPGVRSGCAAGTGGFETIALQVALPEPWLEVTRTVPLLVPVVV